MVMRAGAVLLLGRIVVETFIVWEAGSKARSSRGVRWAREAARGEKETVSVVRYFVSMLTMEKLYC